MPLVRVDAIRGRDKEDIARLLDAVHRAILSAFHVPPRDRYQIYQEHLESNVVIQDTGLGIDRTKNVVFVTVTSRPRSQESKQAFYVELCRELGESCGIAPNDVVVSIVGNSDADWSFGNGRAQFVAREL
jgi:phenylpyruvate tautomerase PptA (4-oxalocrotonate tautomerase family)